MSATDDEVPAFSISCPPYPEELDTEPRNRGRRALELSTSSVSEVSSESRESETETDEDMSGNGLKQGREKGGLFK